MEIPMKRFRPGDIVADAEVSRVSRRVAQRGDVSAARRAALLLSLVLLPCCGGPTDGSTVKATVYVDGTVDIASLDALVMRDSEGRRVKIGLQQAEGPAAQFFRQMSRPNVGLTLSAAAPQTGEALCVLASLLANSRLVSRKVFLESHCEHIP